MAVRYHNETNKWSGFHLGRYVSYPPLFRIRQSFDGPTIDDIPASVHQELTRLNLSRQISEGDSVAITAGSRGIANVAEITRSIVDFVRDLGAEPFVVPAMGSHGGATVEGQLAVLRTFGITPEKLGCEIRATMATVKVCESPEGVEIHFDRNAYDADHVIVCNRVKLHTDFTGPHSKWPIEDDAHWFRQASWGVHIPSCFSRL